MVPDAIGSTMEGRHGLFHNLNVFLKISELWKHHQMGKMAFYFFVGNDGPARSLIELDGTELWRLGLSDANTPYDPATTDVEEIFNEVVGPDIPHELISALPWTCHSIVADKWVEGPVFLAGDAPRERTLAFSTASARSCVMYSRARRVWLWTYSIPAGLPFSVAG